jgi:hypothetical protein
MKRASRADGRPPPNHKSEANNTATHDGLDTLVDQFDRKRSNFSRRYGTEPDGSA